VKLKPSEETGLPTYDVDLEAPPDTGWNHLARQESKNIGRLLDDVVNLCVEQAECYPIYIRPLVVAAGKGIARLGGRIVDMIAGCFGEEYVTEIRAIAKHADQPLSHVVLGNLMYDGCQMAEIYGAVGCSSYSCNIDGAPLAYPQHGLGERARDGERYLPRRAHHRPRACDGTPQVTRRVQVRRL
jgi:hypothetical protein